MDNIYIQPNLFNEIYNENEQYYIFNPEYRESFIIYTDNIEYKLNIKIVDKQKFKTIKTLTKKISSENIYNYNEEELTKIISSKKEIVIVKIKKQKIVCDEDCVTKLIQNRKINIIKNFVNEGYITLTSLQFELALKNLEKNNNLQLVTYYMKNINDKDILFCKLNGFYEYTEIFLNQIDEFSFNEWFLEYEETIKNYSKLYDLVKEKKIEFRLMKKMNKKIEELQQEIEHLKIKYL